MQRLLLVFFIQLAIQNWVFALPKAIELNNYPFSSPYQATLSSQIYFADLEKFDEQGTELKVSVLANRPDLPFKVWRQSKPAPAVFLIPGFASHYRSDLALSLAKLLYLSGLSVISVANPFNFDFFVPALNNGLPGYTPEDTKDLHLALRQMARLLTEKFQNEFTDFGVVGYSSGGLFVLFLAQQESLAPEDQKIGLNHFLAINPPVDPVSSIQGIEDLYNTYQNWPDEKKPSYYIEFVQKMSDLKSTHSISNKIEIIKSLKDDVTKVAIGTLFELDLQSILLVAYTQGALTPLMEKGYFKDLEGKYSTWNRKEFYKTLKQNYNFRRYIDEAVIAYYQLKDPTQTREKMIFNSGLFSIEEHLKNNNKIYILHNIDDSLMHTSSQLQWLANTLGDRLILFDKGGHLGNLYMPQVQSKIIEVLKNSSKSN